MFKSRRISPEKFVKEFFETLTPGVIPRSHFIDWKEIQAKCKSYDEVLDYFGGLRRVAQSKLEQEITDTLLSADNPKSILKGAFELLGHTNDYYVSDVDNLNLDNASPLISSGQDKIARYCARLLLDLGLGKILASEKIANVFLGVQVGLESNRRKSVGGEAFNNWIRDLLDSTCGLLGKDFEVIPEQRVLYHNSTTGKKVDFAIRHKGVVRIGIEVNFYTTSGSKPSEIKRAYENVHRELRKVGVELVWITDGAGYLKMKRSLEEAFQIQPNTYNYEMARRYLKDDILDFLRV